MYMGGEREKLYWFLDIAASAILKCWIIEFEQTDFFSQMSREMANKANISAMEVRVMQF